MSPTENKFSASDREQWECAVSRVLRGTSSTALNYQDEDGLEVSALYQLPGLELGSKLARLASRLPARPENYIRDGWEICQPIYASLNSKTLNQHISEEIKGGADSILFLGGPTDVSKKLHKIFQGVKLSEVGIYLGSTEDVLSLLGAFSNLAENFNLRLSDLRFGANLDPFSPNLKPSLLEEGLQYLEKSELCDVPSGFFRANGWNWHNHGMTVVQELAYILASLTEILRSAHARNINLADFVTLLSASVALPADLFEGITKCRALRQCWAGLVKPLGLDPAQHPLLVHAGVSLRMFTTVDSETNILRTTTALLGGAIGGADQISSFAHDCISGSSFDGRRLARMQHHLMIEESGLARSLDPAGGAGFIESRSHHLATAAWEMFQKIEANGGALSYHNKKKFHDEAQKSAAKRFDKFASGGTDIVGVNVATDHFIFYPALPEWMHVRRPAAAVELIRKAVKDHPPRILTLRSSRNINSTSQDIDNLLQMGGMQPVRMCFDEVNSDSISAARPDQVILIEKQYDELSEVIKVALKSLEEDSRVFSSEDIFASGDTLRMLSSFAGVDLSPFDKGLV